MVNKYVEEVNLYGARATENEDNYTKWYYIAPAIFTSVLLLIIIVLVRRRRLRKPNQNEGSVVYTIPVSDPQYSVEYIYRPVYKNQRNPIYLVPYSALPEDFDFSRPDVIVRGDYIILKDLHILEQPIYRPPSTPTTPTTPTTPSYFDGFNKQPPYNPNFY